MFLQAISGNSNRKIFVRPDSYKIVGKTILGVVMADLASYSSSFNYLVIRKLKNKGGKLMEEVSSLTNILLTQRWNCCYGNSFYSIFIF